MKTAATQSPTAAASAELLERMDRLRAEMDELERQLSEKRRQHTALRSAVETLLVATPEAERGGLRLEALNPEKVLLRRISKEAREIIEKLKSDAQKVWRVEEIQKYAENKNMQVSDRYASNLLGKLHEQGLLTKVSRGLYRANDTLLAIEGLEGSDYE